MCGDDSHIYRVGNNFFPNQKIINRILDGLKVD
jgi:hypothetical protein